MPEIVTNHFRLVDKKLAFCLEIAELEKQVDRRRLRYAPPLRRRVRWAQIEIDAALLLGETRQAIQIMDLAGGKYR